MFLVGEGATLMGKVYRKIFPDFWGEFYIKNPQIFKKLPKNPPMYVVTHLSSPSRRRPRSEPNLSRDPLRDVPGVSDGVVEDLSGEDDPDLSKLFSEVSELQGRQRKCYSYRYIDRGTSLG